MSRLVAGVGTAPQARRAPSVALVYDLVYPFVPGGVQRRNYAIAIQLALTRDVALYGFSHWRGAANGFIPGCRYVDVGPPARLYSKSGRRLIREPLLFSIRLLPHLMKSQEEVWDVANIPYFPLLVAGLLARLRRKALVATWCEFWGDLWPQYLGPVGFVARWVETLALRTPGRLVAISEHTKKKMVAAGVAPERIDVVPCGVDVAQIRAAAAAKDGAEMLFVGRLIGHKRADLAIDALTRLGPAFSYLRLDIVGDGPERTDLERRVQALGLQSRVRFLGELPEQLEVYARMKAASLLVAPSSREGFGIVAVEAWACGLPVVVCEGPDNALATLVECPALGRVVAPAAEEIARACEELLTIDDEGARSERAAIAERYDWERIVSRIEAIYDAEWRRTETLRRARSKRQ
ncbi:MAG: glycosyltransferase family 4 protein [Thermoanaerobaculia bacterium]